MIEVDSKRKRATRREEVEREGRGTRRRRRGGGEFQEEEDEGGGSKQRRKLGAKGEMCQGIHKCIPEKDNFLNDSLYFLGAKGHRFVKEYTNVSEHPRKR